MANEYHYSRLPKAIPGFITLTLENDTSVVIALQAITAIGLTEGTKGKSVIRMINDTPAWYRVQESPEEVMSLIHKAQHPAE